MFRRIAPGSAPLAAAAVAAATLIAAAPALAGPRPSTDETALGEISRRAERQLEARRPALFGELRAAQTGPQAALNAEPGVELMFLNDHGHPVFYATKSRDAARDINVDDLWPGAPSGFNLDGSATGAGELALWDYGSVRTTHQELTGRASWADGATYSPQDHSTLVGGIMASTGVLPQAQGMSFAAFLDSYDWTNDVSEMATAAANGLKVSNHSYGFALGWRNFGGTWYWAGDMSVSTAEDFYFGFYDSLSMNLDQIAVNAPDYTIVVAAGNDHAEGPAAGAGHYHWNGSSWVWATDVHDIDGGSDGYDCLDIVATAKNVITVGAVQDLVAGDSWNAVTANFSNRGPTDDGRIKPDFVANGTTVTSAGGTSDNVYLTASGTSMAAPSLAGGINLLREYYEATHGGQSPLSSTIKALLVNTVSDVGPNLGPDYITGWGVADVFFAAGQLQNAQAGYGSVTEGVLNDGETHVYWFHDVGGQTRITLAWTDPAGAPPPYSLNPGTSMLVNDLDLRAYWEPDGQTYYPYVLDPSNPAAPATTGDNTRDNVEKLDYQASYFWDRIEVSHKGTLAGPQPYSLVSSVQLTREHPLTEITSSALPDSSEGKRISWIDYDGDGDDDLHLLAGGSQANTSALYRNDGGTFSLVSDTVAGAAHNNISWADYDDDGDLDYYASGLYRNDGGGVFSAETNNPPYTPFYSSPINSDWADYDGDGDVDLYIVHQSDWNRLWRNDGANGFTDVTPSNLLEDILANYRGTWIDYDEDGDPDLHVSKGYDPGEFYGGPPKLYRNDGNDTFVDVADNVLQSTSGRDVDWGDYDRDGDLDLAAAGWNNAIRILRNDGGGDFVNVTPTLLDTEDQFMSIAWVDLDSDGNLDLFAGGGDEGNRVFLNRGNDEFADATSYFVADILAVVPGVSFSDWDDDGDLDLATVDTDDRVRLLQNDLPAGQNWLKVQLAGGAGPAGFRGTTLANAAAIGARIRVVAGGTEQLRMKSAQSGRGRDSYTLYFGMCGNTQADLVEITWPTSGTVETLTNVALNQVLTFTEGSGTTDTPVPLAAAGQFRLAPAAPNPFRTGTELSFEIAADEPVRLVVYDVTGRLVRTLVDARQPAGRHAVRWDGRDDRGTRTAAGVYFYRLEAGPRSDSRRVVLLR